MASYPIALDVFLPARRTDTVDTTVDLDEVHNELWERADHRNDGEVEIGLLGADMTPAMKAMMVAQGRLRISGKQRVPAHVKDPMIWAEEAIDFRDVEVGEGRGLCQFCGDDYELPPPPRKFVICNPCGQLLGIRVGKDLWDSERNLKQQVTVATATRVSQVPVGQDEVVSRFEDGDHPTWIAEDLGMSVTEVKSRLKRAGKKLPRGRAPSR